jgi:hypothetical protein
MIKCTTSKGQEYEEIMEGENGEQEERKKV